MSDKSYHRKKGLKHGIQSLWSYWALAMGSLTALSLLSPILAAKWMPLCALAIVVALMYLDKRNRAKKSPDCFRQPFIIIVVLTLTAAAIGVTLLIDPDAYGSPYAGANTPNPLVTILTLGPVSVIVSGYYLLRGNNPSYCKACMARNGDSVDRGLIGAIYHRETAYQNKYFFAISLTVTIVTWIYYLCFYINVNINSADRFYFAAFPSAIYIFSMAYLGIRYYSMWNYYVSDPKMSKLMSRKGTTLRFILINDESIFLAPPSLTPGDEITAADDLRVDTPAILRIDHRDNVPIYEAIEMFNNGFNLPGTEIKYLYESHDYSMMNNVMHYCAYLPNEECTNGTFTGEWFTFGEVVRMIESQMVSTALTMELKRVCTISMTFKTYDQYGNRRYPVRHYRPTFRLSDLKKVDVDYNDNNWLAVSVTNADKRFFRLRRFWKRFVKGVGV